MKSRITTAVLTATVATIALVPLNMGGCAPPPQMGEAVGGLIEAGGGDGATARRVSRGVSAGTSALQALTIDEQAEAGLGESVALAVTNRYGLSNDVKLNRYVALVGQTVAAASARPDIEWTFGVLDTSEVNAFSGPAGYVMITRGAVERMRDESELAGVLAHEVAHVVNQDGLSAVRNSGALKAGAEIAKAADARVNQWAPATETLVDFVVKNGYSKPQELKADEGAVRILIAAGYDPSGYQRFLTRLEGSSAAGGAMSTHPGAADRAQRASSQIAREHRQGGGATLRERFQSHVRRGR